MEFKVQLVISEGESERVVEDIVTLEKEFDSLEDLGLTIEEAKGILRTLQQRIVNQQTAVFNREHRDCRQCGNRGDRRGAMESSFEHCSGTSN